MKLPLLVLAMLLPPTHCGLFLVASLSSFITVPFSGFFNATRTMAVSFVNGIHHTEQDVNRISEFVGGMFNTTVKAFYNPTSGNWAADATRAGYLLVSKPADLQAALQLASHLRSLLNSVGPNGRVLHLAHSGGAILTYLAAKHHLSSEEKRRIDVITFGGGRSITRKHFSGKETRVVNYYARNDPILYVDMRAARLIKQTANVSLSEIVDKHNSSFVFLAGLANNPMEDHSMEGPTYRYALRIEADEFRARLEALRVRAKRDADVIRKVRKRAANATNMHHFWSRLDRAVVQLREEIAAAIINATLRTSIPDLNGSGVDNAAYSPKSMWLISLRLTRKWAARFTGRRGFFSRKFNSNGISENSSVAVVSANSVISSPSGATSAVTTELSVSVPAEMSESMTTRSVAEVEMVMSGSGTDRFE